VRQHCDVYLMWPEPKDQLAERMKAVNAVAEKYDRTLDYGLRVHVIVRDTEPRRGSMPSTSSPSSTMSSAR
jgi:alkanesulfonate monooxygenase SsuD/methylene tetrahydromethanopterin reductase-like flavin-dependent oxidoreductase (luciferase family)